MRLYITSGAVSIAVVALLLCVTPQAQESNSPQLSSDAYAVYSVVVPRISHDALQRMPQQFVILDHTQFEKAPQFHDFDGGGAYRQPTTDTIEGCFPSKYRKRFEEAFHDFERVNRHRLKLDRHLNVQRPYEFVSDDQLKQMTTEVEIPRKVMDEQPPRSPAQFFRWEDFYKQFPRSGGYVALSDVGFDSSSTKAVVSVGLHCGGLCGKWTDYLLEKRKSVWTIVGVTTTCGGES